MNDSGDFVHLKPNIRDSLKSLGFTDYFINIYIGLMQYGEQNAHELSKLTKVPYSRIYEVLNDMIKRNLITKVDGRPSTFLANDPDTVFKNLKKRQEDKFEENVHISLPFLNQIYGGRQVKKSEFIVYEGMKVCMEHLRNVINPTAHNLQIVLNDIADILPFILNNLDFMYTKQVSVQLLINEKDAHTPQLKELNGNVKIRTINRIYQNLLISDEQKAMEFIKGHFDIAQPSIRDYTLLTSNNPQYLTYISELFASMWEDGQKL